LILITDDNEVTIQLLTDYLVFKGYRVAVAHNGAEAAEQAHKEQPDLILMDIQMPVMNGLDAMHLIRKDGQLSRIPIIALTSLDMPGHRADCLSVGANDYMSKPVRLKALLASIETLLEMG
jgi:CheY-like chemotaxis protein